jgi:hypothetical protein
MRNPKIWQDTLITPLSLSHLPTSPRCSSSRDSSNLVKTYVIKAEDARILGDMKSMRRMYTELFTLNNQLIGEFEIRSKNHQALLDALKQVNHMVRCCQRKAASALS